MSDEKENVQQKTVILPDQMSGKVFKHLHTLYQLYNLPALLSIKMFLEICSKILREVSTFKRNDWNEKHSSQDLCITSNRIIPPSRLDLSVI